MFVESSKPFPGRLNVLRRDVPHRLRLEHAYEPPVRVAIVQQQQLIPLDNARLPINGREESVQRVDEGEVDVLVRNRRRRRERVGERSRVVQVIMFVTSSRPDLPLVHPLLSSIPDPQRIGDFVSGRGRLVLHNGVGLGLDDFIVVLLLLLLSGAWIHRRGLLLLSLGRSDATSIRDGNVDGERWSSRRSS
jgi:hypothetical protein